WGGGGRLKEILNSGDMEFIKFNFPKFNGFAGIIDNNIVLNEKYGLPVMSYDGFKSQFPNDIVIISIYDYITADSIRRTLLNDNIPCVIFRDLIDITKRQYFDFFYDEGLFIDDEVFVHAGCWDGYTQKWFTEYVGNKYKKMITFEPSSAYENCKIALSGLRDVNVINAGLGDKNKSLAFTEKVDFLVSAHFSESGERSVNIVTLDDFLKNEKVTFIALDVEGFEMAVLRGAYRIITKQRPKLAISVYHKLEDIIEIPKYIKKLNQEYKLALRSYGVNTFCDTICYAW
ncbi:MAG: FkbM family methyltransferase, partial [Treponema sp.]|nr:FkbM family methyltransferase [Treponema sp.]